MILTNTSIINFFIRYLFLISISLSIIYPAGVFAKQGYTVLKIQDGVLIVWNDSKAYFTVELPGTSFKHVSMDGLAFLVDGNLVQIITVKPTKFSKRKDTPEIVLQKHRDWEIKHWEKLLKEEVTSDVIENNDNSESDVSLWQITWPEGAARRLKSNAIRNLWATRVVGNRVISISVPMMKENNESEISALFHKVSQSFKRYPEPVDPVKIQADLRTSAQ